MKVSKGDKFKSLGEDLDVFDFYLSFLSWFFFFLSDEFEVKLFYWIFDVIFLFMVRIKVFFLKGFLEKFLEYRYLVNIC